MSTVTQELIDRQPFAAHCGITLQAAAPEEVRGALAWRAELCTTYGTMHGGAIMTFGDTLGALCGFLNLPEGAATSTIESKTNFFRGVPEGEVTGVARPLHVGRTTIVVQTDITREGRRIAQVTQTQAVLTGR
ncbi:MAG: hotdog fold thioesterase [Streptosporangiales bacterium]|nr:hotdog fold thioesterase [Streptosporangiales bacterium]